MTSTTAATVVAPREEKIGDSEPEASATPLLDLLLTLVRRWKLIVFGALGIGLIALAVTFAIKPTFTAKTTFLPPQQQQSGAAAALASLGSLASLAGSAAGLKSPADQYAALLQSATIEYRLIDRFKLLSVYRVEFRTDARLALENATRIAVGKKDGLISVEVDDQDPQRAADLANQYVEELRRVTTSLSITEAQQRRTFFEAELAKVRIKLANAQSLLQDSGFNPGSLRAEPKAAAEGYARLKSEVTGAEVRLQILRRSFAENTPEVQLQASALLALQSQLGRLEHTTDTTAGADYIGKYRDFKYQESLFEAFSKQYEIARLDEGREGPLIQVVDPAIKPEVKSKPKRGSTAILTTLISLILLSIFVLRRAAWLQASQDPRVAEKTAMLRAAIFGKSGPTEY